MTVRKQLADSLVEVVEPAGYTLQFGKELYAVLKQGGKETFKIDEIRGLLLRVNGYAFTSLGPDRAVTAPDKFGCKVTTSYVPSGGDQVWKLTAKLYYPDENKQCVVGSSQPAFKGEGTAFDVEKTVDIRVRDKNVLTPTGAAFAKGKTFYNEAKQETNERKQLSKFESAVQEFNAVLRSAPAEGGGEEFLAYYWSVISLVQMHAIQKRIATGSTSPKDQQLAEKYKSDAMGIVKAFEAGMGDAVSSDDEYYLASGSGISLNPSSFPATYSTVP